MGRDRHGPRSTWAEVDGPRSTWAEIDEYRVGDRSVTHGGIRYGALSSQRSHSNAYAVLSPLAATLLMAQTQSIIVTCTGFHAIIA